MHHIHIYTCTRTYTHGKLSLILMQMCPPWNTRTVFPLVTIKCISKAICMCVLVPNSAHGPIISCGILSCSPDRCSSVYFLPSAHCVCSYYNNYTHTHTESLCFASTDCSSRVICCWLWVYVLRNVKWIHSISKLLLPISLTCTSTQCLLALFPQNTMSTI